MSLAILYSRAQVGMDAPLVTVEVHLSNGLPGLSIVGLPETAVKESKDRVRGALLNSRFEFPMRRITINLAPADLPKEGGRFDLPIALGILAASGQIPGQDLPHYEFAGELALSGELRPVHGILPMTVHAQRSGRALVVPADNVAEATLVRSASVYAVRHLLDISAHLTGTRPLEPQAPSQPVAGDTTLPDLVDVRGQHHARRALEIAAAGGHSLLLVGPPGTGKSLLASRLPGVLPELTEEEAMETAAVNSISGQANRQRDLAPPSLPRTAPYRLGRRAGRRRVEPASRGNLPRPSWRAVSRRAARVRPAGAGGAARTARVRAHHDFTRGAAS